MTQLLTTLADRGLLPLGALLLALLLLANEIGYRLGRWRASVAPESTDANLGMLTAGMLGLLAFTLSLTISIAEQRFEARRDQVLAEANTIGTAWLRAGLVRGPEAAELRRELEDYARIRLDYTRAGLDPEREAALDAATGAAQTRIWQLMETVAHRDPNPLTAGLATALTDAFDAALGQRFAYESRVPPHIQWLLLAGFLLSVGAVGVQLGLGPHRHLMLSVLLMVMWTGGMLLIIDLNRPRQGQIRVDPAPLVWTLQGFGTAAPAAPPN